MDYNIAVKKVLQGDSEAYEEIVKEYFDFVYKICMGFMRDEQDALDMTQEVFLSVYNSLDKFQNKSKVTTWLYRISANTCLNHLKKMHRFKTCGIDEVEGAKVSDDSLYKKVEFNDLIDKLDREIDNMGGTTSKIIKLRLFEKRKFEDIAKVLNIPGSTVRAAFTRSKKVLQKLIRNYNREV